MIYLLVIGAVLLAYLFILGLCMAAGNADRAIDKHAQERAAQDALRPYADITVFPRRPTSSSSGVHGDPPGWSHADCPGGEPAA